MLPFACEPSNSVPQLLQVRMPRQELAVMETGYPGPTKKTTSKSLPQDLPSKATDGTTDTHKPGQAGTNLQAVLKVCEVADMEVPWNMAMITGIMPERWLAAQVKPRRLRWHLHSSRRSLAEVAAWACPS